MTELNFNQSGQQQQKQKFNQNLNRNLQILQYNSADLTSFLEDASMDNPFIEIETTSREVPLDKMMSVVDRSAFTPESSDRDFIADNQSLYAYLLEQIHLTMRDTYLRDLVLYLVTQLDEGGFLTVSLEDAIAQTQSNQVEILDALTLLQQLDPPGVGARNLQEALMLQTEKDDFAPPMAYLVLESAYDLLINKKWQQITEQLPITLPEVQEIMDYIQTLSFVPGSQFSQSNPGYIRPDLILKVDGDQLQLSLTKVTVPQIKFQTDYFDKMGNNPDPEVQKYLAEKKANYQQLQAGINQRGDTLLKVGNVIVEQQAIFFTDSAHQLKPLLLKDVANEIKMHQSTVSRCVNGKYIQTDFGVFELKSFFSQPASRHHEDNDEVVSGATAKEQLIQIIVNEDKIKPLSDQHLVEKLAEVGIRISRRTVTKYRELLNIPNASHRKRFD